MAACLACGASAVVSHRSAAALWQLVRQASPSTPVDVSIPVDSRRVRPGIRVRRVPTLTSDEVTELDGIPITTPARTLYDLGNSVGARELERALAEAFAQRLVRPTHLQRLLSRFEGRRGSRALRTLLEDGEPVLTRSEAEERFLALIRKAQLDSPAVNAEIAGYEVDFLWRAERLVVEIDGFAFHSSPGAFEGDRRRDAVLAAAGLRVMRVTWRHLLDEPEAVLARLAKVLALAG
jgi:very-short-patch-repair endonuclease